MPGHAAGRWWWRPGTPCGRRRTHPAPAHPAVSGLHAPQRGEPAYDLVGGGSEAEGGAVDMGVVVLVVLAGQEGGADALGEVQPVGPAYGAAGSPAPSEEGNSRGKSLGPGVRQDYASSGL